MKKKKKENLGFQASHVEILQIQLSQRNETQYYEDCCK